MSRNQADSDAISSVAARWVTRRDAGLSTAESAELEAWLASDARHRSAFSHYAKTWSIFDRPRLAQATDRVVREVSNRAKRRRRTRLQAAGAALAILVVLGAVGRWVPAFGPRTASAPAARAVVLRPERQTLADGSIVEMKSGTGISVKFDDVARRVTLLRGEAHFQVVKSPARPFVVDASGVEVRAVGTAFAVQLTSGEVEVLVTEGRVAVARPAAPPRTMEGAVPSNEPLATLGVGDRIVVGLAPTPAESAVVTAVPEDEIRERLAWRLPRLEFSATPLAKAVELMNDSALPELGSPQVRIVLDRASPDLAEEPVSGLFRADNAEAFVHVLELSLGIRSERHGNEIMLRNPR